MNKRVLLGSLGLAAALGILVYQSYLAPRWRDQGRVLGRYRLDDGSSSIEIVSQPYRLDRVYMSMSGPRGNQPNIRLTEAGADDEVVWLTGLETSVVDAVTLAPLSNEYFCHSNLTLNPDATTPAKHNASFAPPTHSDWRLFTLIPGRMSTHLPEGFGIPVRAGGGLDHFTMSLNQNPGHPDQSVRMKTTIRFRRGPDAAGLKPLFRRSVYVYQQHEELPPSGILGKVAASKGHQGEECAESCPNPQTGGTLSQFVKLASDGLDRHPGATCCVANASQEGVVPQFGKENTIHWMVPPGKHRYRSEVTAQMELPFDTTVHYVTGHLHPYGTALKLIDLETGTTLFTITAQCFSDRLGVANMSEIIVPEGIPLAKGRRYELIADYDNTSAAPIDAMAILYLYARDQLK